MPRTTTNTTAPTTILATTPTTPAPTNSTNRLQFRDVILLALLVLNYPSAIIARIAYALCQKLGCAQVTTTCLTAANIVWAMAPAGILGCRTPWCVAAHAVFAVGSRL